MKLLYKLPKKRNKDWHPKEVIETVRGRLHLPFAVFFMEFLMNRVEEFRRQTHFWYPAIAGQTVQKKFLFSGRV